MAATDPIAETERRLDSEHEWYRSHAHSARRMFWWLKGIQLISAAMIPVASVAIADDARLRLTVSLLGAIIAIAEGIVQLTQCDKAWHRWQTAAQALRRERSLFVQGIRPYDSDDPETNRRLCGERVEDIIAHEHGIWVEQRSERRRDGREPRKAEDPR